MGSFPQKHSLPSSKAKGQRNVIAFEFLSFICGRYFQGNEFHFLWVIEWKCVFKITCSFPNKIVKFLFLIDDKKWLLPRGDVYKF